MFTKKLFLRRIICVAGLIVHILANQGQSLFARQNDIKNSFEHRPIESQKNGEQYSQMIEDQSNQVFLENLYQKKSANAKRRFMRAPIVSKAVGALYADAPTSRPYIKKFLKKYPDILLQADQFETPKGGLTAFKTFNHFFYRKLSKKGYELRPVDRNRYVVVSPADCSLFVVPDLSKDPDFFVKGCKFNLEKFIADKKLAKQYKDGILLLFRLAPNDYHRFHFPFDCIPSMPKRIHGFLESVNPIAYTPTSGLYYKNGKIIYSSQNQPLTENERHLIMLKSDIFGDVICVIIGAMMVGCIRETYVEGLKIQSVFTKGFEMGYFAFGGSSIALIFKRGTVNVDEQFIVKSGSANIPSYDQVYQKYTNNGTVKYPESKIKMGQRIAVFADRRKR